MSSGQIFCVFLARTRQLGVTSRSIQTTLQRTYTQKPYVTFPSNNGRSQPRNLQGKNLSSSFPTPIARALPFPLPQTPQQIPLIHVPPSHQFGLYIMFPIGWMYYFGTNLESRFSIPDFWPAPETTHKIPFEREEIKAEVARLRAKRLEKRARRLQMGGKVDGGEEEERRVDQNREGKGGLRWSLDRGAWESAGS